MNTTGRTQTTQASRRKLANGLARLARMCFLLLVALEAAHAAKQSASAPVSSPPYIIQVGDQLDIKLFYNNELNEQVTVRPDGRISLQLANEVVAAGLTPDQLRETLLRVYATQLKAPELSVIVRSFTSQRLFVDGEVGHPGLLNLVGPMRLMDAISQAGGVKNTARTHEVLIIRRGGPGPEILKVNLSNLRRGRASDQDFMLRAYDVVYVPKSRIANMNQWVDQYIAKNIPATFGIYSNPF